LEPLKTLGRPIRAIKEIIRFGGILGPAMIAATIILLIVSVIWAAQPRPPILKFAPWLDGNVVKR
jgi:hypothetical protein